MGNSAENKQGRKLLSSSLLDSESTGGCDHALESPYR
jgi:hypothetical protein